MKQFLDSWSPGLCSFKMPFFTSFFSCSETDERRDLGLEKFLSEFAIFGAKEANNRTISINLNAVSFIRVFFFRAGLTSHPGWKNSGDSILGAVSRVVHDPAML